MPIYEYACEKCGEFEVSQRITEEPLKKCPTCRRKVRKLISNTSFQLKGSGWYVTDYARKGKESGTAKDAGGESKPAGGEGATASDSGATGSGDAKPAAESKAKPKSTKATGTKAA